MRTSSCLAGVAGRPSACSSSSHVRTSRGARSVEGLVAALLIVLWACPALGGGWPSLKEVKAVGDGSRDAAVVAAAERYAFVPEVPGARRNGQAWFRYLTQGRGIAAERVSFLLDSQVTNTKLRRVATEAAAAVKPGGTLWFVFIGHGTTSKDGQGLLVGADAQQDAEMVAERSVLRQELLSILGKSAASRVVVVLDACFSGTTSTGKPLVPGLMPIIPDREPAPVARTIVLTAAARNEFAGPLPGAGRPAFSYLVLGGLRGWADADGDGAVTGKELSEYAAKVMRAVVQDRTQTPSVEGGSSGDTLAQGWEKAPNLSDIMSCPGCEPGERRWHQSRRTWGWITLGVGAALALGSVPFFQQAVSENNSAQWASSRGDAQAVNQYNQNAASAQTNAIIFSAVGGAVLVTGAVLAILGDSAAKPSGSARAWRLLPTLNGFAFAASF